MYGLSFAIKGYQTQAFSLDYFFKDGNDFANFKIKRKRNSKIFVGILLRKTSFREMRDKKIF